MRRLMSLATAMSSMSSASICARRSARWASIAATCARTSARSAADAVELRGDGLELGARDVELRVEVGRSALELAQLDALSLEGSRQ